MKHISNLVLSVILLHAFNGIEVKINPKNVKEMKKSIFAPSQCTYIETKDKKGYCVKESINDIIKIVRKVR